MKKPIILAAAFAWAVTGIHGADEGGYTSHNPGGGHSEEHTSHNHNPGGGHSEEHTSHNHNPGGHHEGSLEDGESAHHTEQEHAGEKEFAAIFKEFIEGAIKATEQLQEENKDVFAGGDSPSKLGFKDDYPSHEVHKKLDELLNQLRGLEAIAKHHSQN